MDRLNYGTVRILAEPIGTRRMDDVTLLDVRRESVSPRTGAFRDGVRGRLQCVERQPGAIHQLVVGGVVLVPLTIVAPRIARIGTTLEW